MPWVSRSLLFFTVTTFNPIDSQFTKFPAVNNEFSNKTKFRPTSFRFHEGFQSQSSSRFSTNIQNKPTTRFNSFGTRFSVAKRENVPPTTDTPKNCLPFYINQIPSLKSIIASYRAVPQYPLFATLDTI